MTEVLRETEKGFQEKVIKLAKLYGWMVYHPYDSRRSAYGWPDLALCRPPRFLLAELKSEQGSLTYWQEEWGKWLKECPGVEYYVWRPSQWQVVERALGKEK